MPSGQRRGRDFFRAAGPWLPRTRPRGDAGAYNPPPRAREPMSRPHSQPPEQDAPTAQIRGPRNVPELDPPGRLLLGPGPSPVHPRVTRALGAPALGHLDPALLELLSETSVLLRGVFRTL